MTTTDTNQNPLLQMQEWIEKEKSLSPANPNRIVLATAGRDGIPHSRIVAIREINSIGLLFFTQKNSRKVKEIAENPYASMTLWLPQQQRQVMLEGLLHPLTDDQNLAYWNKLPREQQLSFFTYAPTSGQEITSRTVLDRKSEQLDQQYSNQPIPLSPHYEGFRLIPDVMYFYTLGQGCFSEVLKLQKKENTWFKQVLSP